MRILRVAQKVYPDVNGGGPYHVHAMSRDQAAMGHDVTVLTVRQDTNLPRIEERDGYTVVRQDPAFELLGNDVSPGVARYLFDATAFDVVHAHSHLYFSTNLAALKAALRDVPLAITNHGLYSQNASEWAFDLYLRSIGRWTFDQADVVFCYTETDRERVREFGVSSRIEVVSNGIDTERFTPDESESEPIDHDGPVVLFVGRLVEGKRPTDALCAVAQVRETFPNVELHFCGDGPLRSELKSIARDLGLRDSVRFHGQVPYDEMPGVYRSSDVLVLPSRSEGVPRTVLEAMATGTPVVTSDLDQLTSIVERGGQTATTGCPDEFASALEDELLDHTVRSPRAAIEAGGYEWQHTVDKTTRYLREIGDLPDGEHLAVANNTNDSS
ncbi:glycosyltransferase family 4 protein [Natronobeatus ordinarius]|uniref:glycosyltransferase family 4 protein n=1 Tax=Natronobeatus ordinarius TaxID=2963433 RepID=UPI0020CC65A1|nr:glycosyltransferase family 4 protein [Natronobeatus ordinarius]